MISLLIFYTGSKCFSAEFKIYMVPWIGDIWSWTLWKTKSSKRNVGSSYTEKQNYTLRARVRCYIIWKWCIIDEKCFIDEKLWQICSIVYLHNNSFSCFCYMNAMMINPVLELQSHAAWISMTIRWMHTFASFKLEAVSNKLSRAISLIIKLVVAINKRITIHVCAKNCDKSFFFFKVHCLP